ncbi:hypothetical protein HPB49_010245 [Dermacentor silvarum]|uniref:Uncharacterized protein n=1 Tax=Dermacentor silvarum TaxID=543639 RepID=A0ACB8DCM0_DERSI|nr:hypothetical protein HPB49_010245 [Dermacentor silvarum]
MPPPDSCKGIVRNIEPNTSSVNLMEGLRAPNYEVPSACMMGATATVLVTFRGTYIPYEVIYRVGILRGVPNQPRAQFCTACLAFGHRLDVCPNSNVNRCKICGHTTIDSNSPHDCQPGCPNCGKDHAADDPDCETRKTKRVRPNHAGALCAEWGLPLALAARHVVPLWMAGTAAFLAVVLAHSPLSPLPVPPLPHAPVGRFPPKQTVLKVPTPVHIVTVHHARRRRAAAPLLSQQKPATPVISGNTFWMDGPGNPPQLFPRITCTKHVSGLWYWRASQIRCADENS